MKHAVIYGAGNIGRGFAGQLLSRAGYEICFIDIDPVLVDTLNLRKEYPVRILLDEGFREELVRPVRAVNGRDISAVCEAISQADIIATAVGANAIPAIAPPIAEGLARRGGRSLDIILCENMPEAAKTLRALVGFEESAGLVEAAVGRMVPVQTEEMRDGDPLRVCVEEFAELPVDREAFRGDIPAIEGLQPVAPFSFYLERKLFVHNMGHAIAAYAGYHNHYTYIWEAVEDCDIRALTHGAMRESGNALCRKYSYDFHDMDGYIFDLLRRFGNRQLGDTIARVGRDLPRKLGERERLRGAARLCGEQGVACPNIRKGIDAALAIRDKQFF